MEVKDLVLTADGHLGYVEEMTAEQIRMTYANTSSTGLYPSAAPLVVVARGADLERARQTLSTKEG